jgi:hypothetical protein
MSSIFKIADLVLAWLGEATVHSNIVFEFYEYTATRLREGREQNGSIPQGVLTDLR